MNLLRFLSPLLGNGKLDDATRSLYAGTLRILLVLLHDFPDFLAAYHHSLTDAVPPSCVQLIQVILGAFPSSIRIPDPFAPGFVLDQHPDARASPIILSDFTAALVAADVRGALDKAMMHRAPQSVIPLIKERILAPVPRTKPVVSPYNLPLLSSIVLYIGVAGANQAKETGAIGYSPSATPAQLFKQLVRELEPEGALPFKARDNTVCSFQTLAGRYYALFYALNQLRWPNAHTAWFSSLLLDTFTSASTSAEGGAADEETGSLIREQITRVFLERLLVQRPHPFGLLHAFIRLLTLPDQQLLEHGFVRKSDEIRALLAKCSLSIRPTQPSSAQPGLPSQPQTSQQQ